MKKQFIIAAVAATAMLASCMEEPTNNDGKQGEAAQLTISLKQATATSGTRVFNDEEVDADQVINNFIVFVVKVDGNTFDVSPYYAEGSAIVEEDEVRSFTMTTTTDAKKIYIVTNTGAFATGPFKAVRNLNDVKAVVARIDDNSNSSMLEAENVWMAGNSTADFTVDAEPDANGVVHATTSVKLHYLAAKIFVVTENHMTGELENTRIQGVAMINAGAFTGFVNSGTDAAPNFSVARTATNMPAPAYYNGVAIDVDPYFDVPAAIGADADFAVKAAWANQTGFPFTKSATHTSRATLTDADAFYAFPVTGPSTEKTWATLYGIFNENGLETPEKEAAARQAFWSVAWDGDDQIIADPLKSGYKYIVTIELKGNSGSGSSSKEDPTVETINQEIEITVEPAEWIVVESKKVYN